MNPQNTQPIIPAPESQKDSGKPGAKWIVSIVVLVLLTVGYYLYIRPEPAVDNPTPSNLKYRLSDEDLRSLQDELDRIDEDSLDSENF